MSHHENEEQDDSQAELAGLIEQLTQEVTTLRQAVDEMREELTWELRQLREGTPEWKARFRLTSMPADAALPDFHQRVNAVDSSVFAAPAGTLNDLVQGLTSEAAASRLAADDWAHDQDFTPGEVVEIDSPIMDWFSEYLVILKREAEWFLADDGQGWLFVLWSRDEQCYLRLLTNAQQEEICRLAGIQPATFSEDRDASAHARVVAADPEPATTQRSLW